MEGWPGGCSDGPVGGTVDLAVDSGVQTATLDLRVRDARFDQGVTPVMIRRGRLNATIRFEPDGTAIAASAQGGAFRSALSASTG